MGPEPGDRVCDPACGTGGFFLGAYRSIIERFTPLEPDQAAHLRSGAFTGWEIADLPARLCAMNLLLHGIESPESDSPVHVDDALRADPGVRFDMVLTNPPFGRSSSESYERDDFWAVTRNKQLNFVQHVVGLLKVGGTAAVVVPDNVLFEAGAGDTIPPGGCCTTARSTPCCVCPRASSTPRASRPTCCSSAAERAPRPPGPESCGSMTCAPTSTSPSSRTPSTEPTSTTSSSATTPRTATAAKSPTGSSATPTTSSSPATRQASTCCGCGDDSLEDIDNLPPPAVLAAEIAEDLQSALYRDPSPDRGLDRHRRPRSPELALSYPVHILRAGGYPVDNWGKRGGGCGRPDRYRVDRDDLEPDDGL